MESIVMMGGLRYPSRWTVRIECRMIITECSGSKDRGEGELGSLGMRDEIVGRSEICRDSALCRLVSSR